MERCAPGTALPALPKPQQDLVIAGRPKFEAIAILPFESLSNVAEQ
jgi:hypothetical protein